MFILPINRDHRFTRTPVIVITLIAVNSTVLLGALLSGSGDLVYRHFGFTPADPHMFNLFTALFIHAGFLHLLGNMWFLWMFGRQVEDALGSWIFALVYFVCGLGGHALHWALNNHSPIPLVGASGAISGIAGIYFILFPKSRFDLYFYLGWWKVWSTSTFTHVAVGVWIGEQFVLGLITQGTHLAGVAFWAHVGGFVTGLAVAAMYVLIVPAEHRQFIPLNAEDTLADGPDLKDGGLTTLNLDRPDSKPN
ncbi:MAG TPA: rhomboid family intramembrane serine protease [Candidatus Dormibacteraeota bacterium]|nr:rhomboid family intramembrane serine protease [Candidatus Dormibacteraeota bacterium]